ncbi:MAG: sulfatase-like hydrolase/transferase [Archangium sp.]|nr:sulfatase-like hydrolase/transferase [Archangium sp.]
MRSATKNEGFSPAAPRGAWAATTAWVLLALALLPSRLAVAMRVRGGSNFERASRALAGTVLDFSHAAWLVAALLTLIIALAAVPLFRRRVQAFGAVLLVLPCAVALYLITVTEQEVKAERGAFSTLREMLDAAAEPSFIEGAPGFIRYQRILIPALLCGSVFLGVLAWRARRAVREDAWPHPQWSAGFVAVLVAGVLGSQLAVRGFALSSSRLGPAGLGDPLDSVLESAVDSLSGQPPPTPLELLTEWEPTPDELKRGAARLGWPEERPLRCPHPHARALDEVTLDAEPTRSPPARALLEAFRQLSKALFADGDGRVAVVQVSLEGFRADDLAALNPHAPATLAPFINQLYARPHPGVLVSRHTYQAGVRTAQGLAAMTCGLGTLPWNISLIRDLDREGSVPLRCAGDVLATAGFQGSFFYGSDPDYDEMGPFLRRRGFVEVVAEADFPATSPRGAWGGVSDFALVDEAARRVSAGVRDGPRMALVMSLSNHSPFTPPTDLPEDVRARAAALLEPGRAVTTASTDDLKRLVTYAYTDEAVKRFLAGLDAAGSSDRTLVLLIADHSTGDAYVWGPNDFDHETDDAKTRVPFLIVVPPAFIARAEASGADVRGALEAVQRALDEERLSQNDVPSLLLALLGAHPRVAALPSVERWHTLGGQRTSGWFDSGEPGVALIGVNGVDESFALDEKGVRRWPYEDAIFLRTRGDRSRVTPRLAPAAAPLLELSRPRQDCSTTVDSSTVE